MSKSAGRKRAAPAPSDEITLATWVDNAKWNFTKGNWNTKGKAEYTKLKGKVDKSRDLTGYERYLMTVH
jgi:hypothetical protein